MLRINDKEVEITKSTIKFVNAIYNKVKGYTPSIDISFINNDKTGYISFFLDFYLNNSFDNIINKTFKSNPMNFEPISVIEIFDTINFYDNIDSDVTVTLGEIKNNKIDFKLIIDDSLIKIEYDGALDIDYIKK
jgi:hypothetical protein